MYVYTDVLETTQTLMSILGFPGHLVSKHLKYFVMMVRRTPRTL